MYIPLRRVVLSLPTEDETPEEFGQTDMIGGHADPGMPQLPSVLRRCWLGDRKGIRPVKTEWWGAGVVICLERGANLRTAQLMPLPLAVSCFGKIQIGFTFLVPAHPGSPGKRAVKCVCVCVCVRACVRVCVCFVY